VLYLYAKAFEQFEMGYAAGAPGRG